MIFESDAYINTIHTVYESYNLQILFTAVQCRWLLFKEPLINRDLLQDKLLCDCLTMDHSFNMDTETFHVYSLMCGQYFQYCLDKHIPLCQSKQ